MPRVDLAEYEVTHDLLPALCARCGESAAERVTHKAHIVEGPWALLQVFGLLAGLFLFPPLIRLTIRYTRQVGVPVPLCAAHGDHFRSRERMENRYLFPAWTAAALIVDAIVVIALVSGLEGCICYSPCVILLACLAASAAISRGVVTVTRPGKDGIRLSGIHEAFAAALMEDRARDRVSNPDRRGGHGDVRDDFDDEPG